MAVILTLLHIVICLFLIIVVLLQSGKAADLAGAFGGMGSQTAFGPRGSATLLSKATAAAAALFMVTSITLAIIATRSAGVGTSVLEQGVPAAPAQPPVQAPARTPGNAPTPLGKPSMTITPEGGGPSQTVPIEIPPPPSQQAPAQQPAAPPKK
jgi:preprotein translocase subunit SecG